MTGTDGRPPMSPAASDDRGLSIDRDPDFFRAFADDIFVIDRGDMVDLALIVTGPDPVFQSSSADSDSMVFRPGTIRLHASLTEIGRLRISDVSSGNLAINLLERLIVANKIEIRKLQEMINGFVAQRKTEDQTDDGH